MTLSFQRLCEIMDRRKALREQEEGEAMQGGGESAAMTVVRSGLDLRSEDCGSFWDDFMNICNNAEGMSQLLDVPAEQVANWATKVREMVQKIEQADDQEAGSSDKKASVITTGTEME